MQVRKLQRLLKELVEKNPKAEYMHACVDTRFAKGQDHWTFADIPDVEIHNCIWDGESENESQRNVVVLGNY